MQRKQRQGAESQMGTEMGSRGVQEQQQQRSAHSELLRDEDEGTLPHNSPALPDPDPLAAAAALDETAGMLLETGLLPHHLDWSGGGGGGVVSQAASGSNSSSCRPPRLEEDDDDDDDDDDGGRRERKEQGQRQRQDGEGDVTMMMKMEEGSRQQGKRDDGEWDWQALRRGVPDERGDVAFYDASFVEDPWRGLLFAGVRGEGM